MPVIGPSSITRYTSSEDIIAMIRENLDYRRGCGDPDKALLILELIDSLVLETPSRMTHGGRGGEELQFNLDAWIRLGEKVQDWLDSYWAKQNRNDGRQLTAFDLSNFREY